MDLPGAVLRDQSPPVADGTAIAAGRLVVTTHQFGPTTHDRAVGFPSCPRKNSTPGEPQESWSRSDWQAARAPVLSDPLVEQRLNS